MGLHYDMCVEEDAEFPPSDGLIFQIAGDPREGHKIPEKQIVRKTFPEIDFAAKAKELAEAYKQSAEFVEKLREIKKKYQKILRPLGGVHTLPVFGE